MLLCLHSLSGCVTLLLFKTLTLDKLNRGPADLHSDIFTVCLSPRLLLVHTTAAGPHWAPAKAWDLPACAVLVTLQQDPMWMENHCILTQQVSSKTSFTSFNQHFTLISTAGVPVTRHKVTFTSCWLSGKLQLAALRRGIKSYTQRHTKGIIALKRNTSIIGFFFFCCKSTQQLWLFTRQLTRQ